jgi:hypothetical protein
MADYGIQINVNAEVTKATAELKTLLSTLKQVQEATKGTGSGTLVQQQKQLIAEQQAQQKLTYQGQLNSLNLELKKLDAVKKQYEAQKSKQRLEYDTERIAQLKKINPVKDLQEQFQYYQRIAQIFDQLGDAMLTIDKRGIDGIVRWQEQMESVRRTYSDTLTDFDYNEVYKNLQSITNQLRVTIEEVGSIAAIGGQLGIATKDINSFTQAVAMASDTSGETAELVAEGIARIVNLSNILDKL